jgi:hypothetical protein
LERQEDTVAGTTTVEESTNGSHDVGDDAVPKGISNSNGRRANEGGAAAEVVGAAEPAEVLPSLVGSGSQTSTTGELWARVLDELERKILHTESQSAHV